ncbi:MAG: M16 family metallopeptidase [Planctomycetota bacterium]|jgi:zinc protease
MPGDDDVISGAQSDKSTPRRFALAGALLAALLAPACAGAEQRRAEAAELEAEAATRQAEAALRQAEAAEREAEAAAREAEAAAGETQAAERAAAPRDVAVRAWEHETSDVPVDARIRFGHLDNGLRWAWAANPEPKERCYVRLHVDVGSLAEEDDELGMAHFLEHMAFNGSEHFEAGTLIEWFQAHGMAFGADTNAHTNFSETVYKLDLPQADEQTLREGLTVLRDFADGLLLEEEEVQAEKGVIDGEQRERDSAGFRIFEQQLERMFAGTRLAERMPIGTEEVRAAFTTAAVRDFYERWYRPENMTLVAVGDFGELDPEPLFREFFADMEVPEAPWQPEPALGSPARYDHVFSIHEDEVPTVTIAIERLKPWEDEAFTVAELLEDLDLSYARRMLNIRFRELAKQESAPFLAARVNSAEALDVFDGESLSITCAPERWNEALTACEQELRRALTHGFQEAELDEVRADALRGLDEAVEREGTAHSNALLSRILGAAESRYVPADAETRRGIYRPAIESLDVMACLAALRAAWAEGELSVYASGSLDLGDGTGEQLLAAYEQSRATEVTAGEAIVVSDFAYASEPGAAGEIASREIVEDLEFHTLRFANGVAVNVKPTDFKENQILLNVQLGEGRLTLEPDDAALAFVADRVFNGGGLVEHSEDDIRRFTAGKQVGVGFGTADDEFSLGGSTTAEDLLMQCELICAYLQAPGWREEGLIQLRRELPLMFEGLKHQHQGPIVTEFFPELYSGDQRFGLPSQETIEAYGIDDVSAWLGPHLADAPIEVSIVGDLDLEQTVAIASRTFGMLPPRREARRYEERRVAPAPRTGVSQVHAIDTEIPKSLVMIVFPITDGIDMVQRRRFNVLNTVVNDRLRLDVRERLGAAYSPGAGVDASAVYPGVGMLFMQAMSDPDKVDELVEACLAVADTLSSDGVTDEELDRLREPILKRRRDAKRQNSYWMTVMSEAQRRPASLDEVREGDAFYENVSAAELTPLASEYLPRDRASILVVNPGTPDAP